MRVKSFLSSTAESLALLRDIISFSKRTILSFALLSSELNVPTCFSSSAMVSSATINFFAVSSYFVVNSSIVASDVAILSPEINK